MFSGLLSQIFGLAVNRRNKRFDSGKNPVIKTDVPVISIGNISAGGTGKTPFTIALTEIIHELGFNPAIIGRGYRGKFHGGLVVSNGEQIMADVMQSGDEMMMLAHKLPVPVYIHEKKYKAAQLAVKFFKPDCIIVDDGFQHRSLHRDIDIVLIDKYTVQKPYLFPKGKLREKFSSLKRADVICLVDFQKSDLPSKLALPENKLIIETSVLPDEIYSYPSEEFKNQDLKVMAVAGIANPERFFKTLEQKQFDIKNKIVFPDHYTYKAESIKKIIAQAHKCGSNAIVTTEKDLVKLKKFKDLFAENNLILIALTVKMQITRYKEEFTSLLQNKIFHNL